VDYGPVMRTNNSFTDGKRPWAAACHVTAGDISFIVLPAGAPELYRCHELAHSDGTYNHEGVPFKQLWAHITGNRRLIDGKVYLYGKLASN
jgi:hypothetical protein